MLDHETVRRIAAALAGAADKTEGERLVFTVGGTGFAWSALQRVRPKTPRVANPASWRWVARWSARRS